MKMEDLLALVKGIVHRLVNTQESQRRVVVVVERVLRGFPEKFPGLVDDGVRSGRERLMQPVFSSRKRVR